MGKKLTITNRKGQRIVVLLEKAEDPKGLAFVAHGYSGFKEEPHIETFAQACRDKNLTVVRFDTTNTFGESDGKFGDLTATSMYEDLEDVIAWVAKQKWYQEPFYLLGHSLGGLTITLFAEKYPKKVKGLAPISTVVSGKLSFATYDNAALDQWQKAGWREEESSTKPGIIKRIPWSQMIDRLQYDVLPNVGKLTMPVLLLVGEQDDRTPPHTQRLLYDKLPGEREFHLIKDEPHCFQRSESLAEIRRIIGGWIENNEKE